MKVVVVSNIFGIFIPIPRGMIQFDNHIFQMGWFNHQLDESCRKTIMGIHIFLCGVGSLGGLLYNFQALLP